MLRLFASALVALALVTGAALAAGGGPSPGLMTGWDGAANAVRQRPLRRDARRDVHDRRGRSDERRPDAALLDDSRRLRRADRRLRRDDGRRLARRHARSSSPSSARVSSRLASPSWARRGCGCERLVTLPGLWSLDALSRDGRMLYAIQYLGTGPNPRYSVRAVSLVTGKPVGAPLVDKREPDEEMNGSPWARVRSANGAWAYTLYAKPNGTGFVHALDTAGRRAFCVDLPWRTSTQRLAAVRLSLAERRPHARAREAGRHPARRRRHDDVQGDGLREAVARRPRERPRSPSRSPRRPRRCRGWR